MFTKARTHLGSFLVGLLIAFAFFALSYRAYAYTAAEILQTTSSPNFNAETKLPRLTRASWMFAYEANVELCERWGYALEYPERIDTLNNPLSMESKLCALTAADPQRYPMYTYTLRPFFNQNFLSTLPESTWCHDAAGNRINVYSPIMPDSNYSNAANLEAARLAAIRAKCPISIVLNSGEYSLSVYGGDGANWEKDPAVVSAVGTRSWYDFISERKAHYENIITNAVYESVPGLDLYLFYYTDGAGDRNRYSNYWQWVWDYKHMRTVSTIPNSSLYYMQFNSGWTGSIDILTQALNSTAYQISFGDPLSYNWLCGGYRVGQFSDDAHYLGFLKCLYTAGMIGGAAGYFTYDSGFTGDAGVTAPSWLRQIMDLSHAHALFSHLDDFLYNGDLLPGPNQHVWSKDLPAYEFPTGDLTARVLARKHRERQEWLICAWAAGGADRYVSVTIPELGSVTILARSTAAIYRAKPGPVLTLLDTDGMNPTSDLFTITATNGLNGSINSKGHVAVPGGGTETFTFIPDAGYTVDDVFIDGRAIGACLSYTFSNVASEHTIHVTFAPTTAKYNLSVQSQPAGINIQSTVETSETESEPTTKATPHTIELPSGTPVSLTAPKTATVNGMIHTFVRWIYNGQVQPDGMATLNVALTQHMTVQAKYAASLNPPTAHNQAVTITEDTVKTITLTGSDADGALLNYTVTRYPHGGRLTGTAPIVTYTPNPNYTGTDSFTFTVNDGVATSAEATVTLNITPVNDAPTASGQSVITVLNTAASFKLTANDVDGDALTYTVSSPSNGTITGTAPNITYTPRTDFSGADSFTFKAFDGKVYSNVATVNITVKAKNTAPVATNQNILVQKGYMSIITPSATDAENDALTYTVVTQPAHGTLYYMSSKFIYSPPANYVGLDSFTFKAFDGQAYSNVATVSLKVGIANNTPVATSQQVNTLVNTATSVTLIATDVDNDPLTYSIVAQPAHGTLAGTAPHFTYQPASDYSGTDSFTFTVSDGIATSTAATVLITVVRRTASLSASPASLQSLGATITLTASSTGFTQPQYKFKVSANGGTTWTQLRDFSTTPTYSWKPATAGTYQLLVLAREGSSMAVMVQSTPIMYQIVSRTASLSASPSSPQPLGTTVTLTASSTGFTQPQYKFKVSANGGVTWTQLRDFSTTASYAWKPAMAGTYKLLVLVREGASMAVMVQSAPITYQATARTASLSMLPSSPQPFGSTVTLTASSTGFSQPQYKFKVSKDGGATWVQLRDFNATATYNWNPAAAGTYVLKVLAREGTSMTVIVESSPITFLIQ